MSRGVGGVAGEAQPSFGQLLAQQVIHTGFVERCFSFRQRCKPVNEQLGAHHIMPQICQATCLNEAHITGAVYRYFHCVDVPINYCPSGVARKLSHSLQPGHFQ